jgi:hypothetical protein
MIDKDFVVETTKMKLKNAAVELDFGHEYTAAAAAMTHEVNLTITPAVYFSSYPFSSDISIYVVLQSLTTLETTVRLVSMIDPRS